VAHPASYEMGSSCLSRR